MRILQIIHSPEPGGIQTIAQAVSRGLAKYGLEFETAYLRQDAGFSRWPTFLGALRVAAKIVTRRYDALIAYQATASITVGAIGFLVGVPRRIVHQTAMLPAVDGPIRYLDKVAGTLGLYSFNVANSAATQRQFADYPKSYRKRLVLIEHGVEQRAPARSRSDTLAHFGIPDDGPILLNTARLAKDKNQAVLFHALKNLPGMRLVLAGSGPCEAEYRALIRQLGLEDRVQLLGPVPYRAVPDLYAAADIFVFPTLHETFGLSAVEAGMQGLPSIVSDIAAMREVLTVNGRALASFVDPHDILAWEAAIRGVIDRPLCAEDLAMFAAGLSAKYEQEKMLEGYLGVLMSQGGHLPSVL
jgi:glycosyltransferase involved in cell wall biosynthesis